MSTTSDIFKSESNDTEFGSTEQSSAFGGGGIRAFYGTDSSSEVLNEFSSSNFTSASTIPQNKPPSIHTAIPRQTTVDTLEFLEFISKNLVRIIPYEELEVDSVDGITDAFASDASLLQGANMKIIRGKWHTDEKPRQRPLTSNGPIAVALKVFKKALVPAAVRDATGLKSALDDVRTREEVAAYSRLMRDILYEIQIMHQAGANQHEHLAELYGISFEAGPSIAGSGDKDDFSVQRYLRPILVSPLAHSDYPDLRHFLAHKGSSRPRPLPWSLASKLIGDIGEGLHALHHINVVHADLKPENILIYPDEFNSSSEESVRIQARVADFGFSGFKNVREMAPRGGTRIWNAPECLYGWDDVYSRFKRSANTEEAPVSALSMKSAEWSTKVTRDIYSFGLIMVHILLDGQQPLPFGDLTELDRIKLADEARGIANQRLRSMHAKSALENTNHESGGGWNEEVLDRVLDLVDQTLHGFPWARRQSLNAIRSSLVGRYIYDRNLDMMRMVSSNRFPVLASTKLSDPLHQAAASTPAIQLAFKNLPRAIKQSIFQHYLALGLHNLTDIQCMRLQGLCTQEIRDNASFDKTSGCSETSIPSQAPGGPAQSTMISGPLLQIIQGLEEELLDKYYTMKDGNGNICKTLQRFAGDVRGLEDTARQLGLTALHIAAMKGDLRSVVGLLDNGTQQDSKSKGALGYITPLDLAVTWCPEDTDVVAIVQAFLAPMSGAEAYQARLASRVGCKTTLLHMAAARQTSAVLLSLLSKFELDSELLNVRDAYYRTPLHIAAQHGSLSSVKVLIDKGASLQAQDYHGLTPYALAMERPRHIESGRTIKPLRVGSDMLYDVLTYGQRLTPTSADNEAIIQVFNSRSAQSTAPTQLQDLLPFRLPFQLKDYQAPKKTQQQKPSAFTLLKDQQVMTDYFSAVADECQRPRDETGIQDRKYSWSRTAISIPREYERLQLSDTLRATTTGHNTRNGYLLLRPRHGLRFIYHEISDLEPDSYQIVIRLGRIKHSRNNFPVVLEIKNMPTKIKTIQDVLLLQVWQTADCLPLEDHIYTIKFADFALTETTTIEISLSTLDIGSKSDLSAVLALNWLSLEQANFNIPNYAILTATDATMEIMDRFNSYRRKDLDNAISEYRILDEVNYDALQETKYHTMYEEGREFHDPALHDLDKRGLWRMKVKGEDNAIGGMRVGLGNEIIPNFDWTRMIG